MYAVSKLIVIVIYVFDILRIYSLIRSIKYVVIVNITLRNASKY